MEGTELEVLEIIWDWGGEAPVALIAKETHLSTDYVRLICQNLDRHNYLDFLNSKLAKLRGKGKLEAAKRKVQASQKRTVIEDQAPEFGLGKNQKGRLSLNY